jgi:hypothetical protein
LGTLKVEPLSGAKVYAQFLQRRYILPSFNAYFGWRKSTELGRFIGVQNRKLKDRRPRPTRFIGVGYKDSGTARNVSIDASPSWQEVASHNTRNYPMRDSVSDYLDSLNRQIQNPEERNSWSINGVYGDYFIL